MSVHADCTVSTETQVSQPVTGCVSKKPSVLPVATGTIVLQESETRNLLLLFLLKHHLAVSWNPLVRNVKSILIVKTAV